MNKEKIYEGLILIFIVLVFFYIGYSFSRDINRVEKNLNEYSKAQEDFIRNTRQNLKEDIKECRERGGHPIINNLNVHCLKQDYFIEEAPDSE